MRPGRSLVALKRPKHIGTGVEDVQVQVDRELIDEATTESQRQVQVVEGLPDDGSLTEKLHFSQRSHLLEQELAGGSIDSQVALIDLMRSSLRLMLQP